MRRLKYLFVWPLANIRDNRWTAGASVVGVALAVFLVTSLIGFVGGYERGVSRDVDRMGFDMLVTARGCPYEAATLMLRGGVGMRYMPDGVTQRLIGEPEVEALFPMLIHPVRSMDSSGGMILFKGVVADLFEAQGLSLFEGEWISQSSQAGSVVLGFEAAPEDFPPPRCCWIWRPLLPVEGILFCGDLGPVLLLERSWFLPPSSILPLPAPLTAPLSLAPLLTRFPPLGLPLGLLLSLCAFPPALPGDFPFFS